MHKRASQRRKGKGGGLLIAILWGFPILLAVLLVSAARH